MLWFEYMHIIYIILLLQKFALQTLLGTPAGISTALILSKYLKRNSTKSETLHHQQQRQKAATNMYINFQSIDCVESVKACRLRSIWGKVGSSGLWENILSNMQITKTLCQIYSHGSHKYSIIRCCTQISHHEIFRIEYIDFDFVREFSL